MKRTDAPNSEKPLLALDALDARASKAVRVVPVLLLLITTKGLSACLAGIEHGSYLDSLTWGIFAAFAGACFLVWYGVMRR